MPPGGGGLIFSPNEVSDQSVAKNTGKYPPPSRWLAIVCSGFSCRFFTPDPSQEPREEDDDLEPGDPSSRDWAAGGSSISNRPVRFLSVIVDVVTIYLYIIVPIIISMISSVFRLFSPPNVSSFSCAHFLRYKAHVTSCPFYYPCFFYCKDTTTALIFGFTRFVFAKGRRAQNTLGGLCGWDRRTLGGGGQQKRINIQKKYKIANRNMRTKS